MAVGAPDRGEVAFALQLRPMTALPVTVAVEEKKPIRTAPPVPQSASTVAVPAKSEDTVRPAAEREREPLAAERSERAAPTAEPKPGTSEGHPPEKISGQWTQTGAQPLQPDAVRQAEAPDAAPATPSGPVRPEAKAELKPEIPAASARDIKLEVSGGERRVEVRLSERGGEVRVAVRTPDSNLAGALRENLPELTTRFGESGLRSEIWRPSAAQPGEWRHTAQTPAGNLAQEGDPQSRGQGGDAQRDAEQRQARSSQEQKIYKEKGKDFAWLMSSLR